MSNKSPLVVEFEYLSGIGKRYTKLRPAPCLHAYLPMCLDHGPEDTDNRFYAPKYIFRLSEGALPCQISDKSDSFLDQFTLLDRVEYLITRYTTWFNTFLQTAVTCPNIAVGCSLWLLFFRIPYLLSKIITPEWSWGFRCVSLCNAFFPELAHYFFLVFRMKFYGSVEVQRWRNSVFRETSALGPKWTFLEISFTFGCKWVKSFLWSSIFQCNPCVRENASSRVIGHKALPNHIDEPPDRFVNLAWKLSGIRGCTK